MVEPVLQEAINTTVNLTNSAVAAINNSLNGTNTSAIVDKAVDTTTNAAQGVSTATGVPTWMIITFIAVVVLIFTFTLLMKGLNVAISLAINSIIGFFALYMVQLFLLPNLIINLWSVLIVAIGGLLGFVVVLILHAFGLFF